MNIFKMLLVLIGFFIAERISYSAWIEGQQSNFSGTRKYSLYFPESLRLGAKPKSLVVMLHGCKTTAKDFASGTRMNDFAESHQMLVLYPHQESDSNSQLCWNWFLAFNQGRESGESGIIAQMIREVRSHYSIQRDRTWIAGMSAGGAMASIMASCYPDLVSAAAIHSGLTYQAALDGLSAPWVLKHGPVLSSQVTAANAFQCSGFSNLPVRVVALHGAADKPVPSLHLDALVSHFIALRDYRDGGYFRWGLAPLKSHQSEFNPARPPSKEYSYSVTDYREFENSSVLLRRILVSRLDHAWSGGDPRYAYNDSLGPDFSKLMIEFFENRH